MDIELRQGSVTDADVDVLVNASNTLLQLGSGVSGAIRIACGRGYQAFLDQVCAEAGGGLEPGAVVVTHAGSHPRARWIAHLAVMDYRPNAELRGPDEARLRRGTLELMDALAGIPEQGISVGMVALGAGTGNLGVRLPTTIACELLRERAPENVKRVVFHGFTLVEHLNVLDVVRRYFPVDLSRESEDVREYLKGLGDAAS
jgi:O-acetyl-ADP-ribose deacetylase (regulator of RNase III)